MLDGISIRWLKIRIAGAALAFALSAPVVAGAANNARDTAGARALATQGIEAFQAKKFDRALRLFSRAESLYHAPIHLLFMARSHRELGQPVEAFELFNRITREKLGDDAPQAFIDAQDAAKKESPGVKKQIALVTVSVQGTESDVVVLIDGAPLPSALIGAKAPINPGTHELSIEGQSEGTRVEFTVAPGAHEEVALSGSEQSAESRPSSADPVGDSSEQLSPFPGYVSLGVAAVGLGVGVGFTFVHAKQRSNATEAFDENDCAQGCTRAQESDVANFDSRAASAGTIAWVGYGVAAAGAITGVTLLLLSNKRTSESAAVSPYWGLSEIGLTGRF